MYQVMFQDQNKIEIALKQELTDQDFNEMIHQLESLARMYQNINVLMDAVDLEKWDIKILWDQFSFYKEYKSHLQRVALVSDSAFQKFMIGQFDSFTDTEFKTFPTDQIEQAREWIFPSKLP